MQTQKWRQLKEQNELFKKENDILEIEINFQKPKPNKKRIKIKWNILENFPEI